MIYNKRNRDEVMFLHPVVAKQAMLLLDRLEEIGEEVLIVDGKRTPEEQDALYRQVPAVTHVNDSNSYHVWGMAIDIAPVGMFGVLNWNDSKRYETIAREAKLLGFDWGYNLWGFDKPHFQFTGGLTIQDLKNGSELSSKVASPIQSGYAIESRVKRLERALRRTTGTLRMTLEGQLRRLLDRMGGMI